MGALHVLGKGDVSVRRPEPESGVVEDEIPGRTPFAFQGGEQALFLVPLAIVDELRPGTEVSTAG